MPKLVGADKRGHAVVVGGGPVEELQRRSRRKAGTIDREELGLGQPCPGKVGGVTEVICGWAEGAGGFKFTFSLISPQVQSLRAIDGVVVKQPADRNMICGPCVTGKGSSAEFVGEKWP